MIQETCWEDCDVNRSGAVQQLVDLSDIFRRLKQSNIKIAVCSSAPRHSAFKTLQQLNLASAIDKLVSTDDTDHAHSSRWRMIHR